MPSSISSSERHLPIVRWGRVLGLSLLLFLAFVFLMESRLAALGYRPTVHDSEARWTSERARASRLGTHALILVGASRIQLGLDLDTLRQETGLEPVQLAIDGSASAPILAGLAADPAIRGTVIVDYYDHAVGEYGGAAEKLQRRYEMHGEGGTDASPSARLERILTEAVHEHLLSYADEASPLNSLRTRILEGAAARHLLVTLPDRSRLADYRAADMPDYYYRRVARNLGTEVNPASPDVENILAQKIAAITPLDNRAFIQQAKVYRDMVAKIEARGGKVVFVAMPSSGMVREIEERRYPRARFWDEFVKVVGAPAVRSPDDPLLKDFNCPDGSHLDYRDRSGFTAAMVHALGLNRHADTPR